MNIKPITSSQVFKLRQRFGLKQREFWAQLGITQSAGSRYEAGDRRIPQTVQILLELKYGKDPQGMLKRLRAGK